MTDSRSHSNSRSQASLHALVTGGSGFVGSHLVDSLLDSGYRVTVLDTFGSGRSANLAYHDNTAALTVYEHDVRDSFPCIGPVEYVYHLASRASPVDFKEYAAEIAMTNTTGTVNALDYALKHDARVLIASTSEVYGDPNQHPQPEEYNGDVNPRGPRAPYDESKRLSEALGMAYVRKHDLDVRTARIFNTYGPRMRPDDGRVVPTFVLQALEGRDLTVHGDGSQTRSLCYVTDLIRGLRSLAETDGLQGEVMNLGSTYEITIRTLAKMVLDHVNTDSELTFTPRRVDDPDVRCPDITRATDGLDWEPVVSLHDGLRKTINYFHDESRRPEALRHGR